MTAVLTTLLGLLSQFATTAGVTQIANIISALTSLIPFLIKEYQALVPIVQNVIDALRGNGQITDAQNMALDALEEQYDADFEAAVAAYGSTPPPTT